MNASESIVLGVVAGVLTTLIVLGFGALIRRVVLPWYRDFIYDGVEIEGEWNLISETEQGARLSLKQSAYSLSGTCTFVSHDENPLGYEALRVFAVKGTIREKLVELSFRHIDRARLGAGVFLFEVKGDGRRMSGVQSMYSVATSRMTSANVHAFRPGFLKPAQGELALTTPALPHRRKKKKKSKIPEPPAQEPPSGPVAGG